MAVRIPVVFSQHERRSGSIADYEEQLITRIVMESGLDATLIADLKSIEIDTTDHLCIEGLKGDFALATWESTNYVCDHLHRLGIPTLEIIPVDGSDRTFSGDSERVSKKIFLISLATNVPVDDTIKTLKGLLQARSTPVFSIGTPISRAKPKSATPDLEQEIVDTKNSPLEPTTAQQNRRVEQQAITVHVETSDSDFPNIDQLMDELDRFQI